MVGEKEWAGVLQVLEGLERSGFELSGVSNAKKSALASREWPFWARYRRAILLTAAIASKAASTVSLISDYVLISTAYLHVED